MCKIQVLGLMGAEYVQLAATGGEPIGDIYGNFPEIGWNKSYYGKPARAVDILVRKKVIT